MKIRFFSDLHLDAAPFDYRQLDEDVLIVAGDITNGIRGLNFVSRDLPKDIPVIVVLGNHDYYHSDFDDVNKLWKSKFSDTNVKFLQNNSIILDGIKFIGGTMFSDFNLDGVVHGVFTEQYAKNNIPDFSTIGYNGGLWNIISHKEHHEKFLKFLKMSYDLEDNIEKTVVVTHFCPSGKSIPEMYKNSGLNSYWASDVEYLMYGADLWIHGHTHSSFDYMVGNTRVLCNPRGVRNENVVDFNPNLIITI